MNLFEDFPNSVFSHRYFHLQFHCGKAETDSTTSPKKHLFVYECGLQYLIVRFVNLFKMKIILLTVQSAVFYLPFQYKKMRRNSTIHQFIVFYPNWPKGSFQYCLLLKHIFLFAIMYKVHLTFDCFLSVSPRFRLRRFSGESIFKVKVCTILSYRLKNTFYNTNL